MFKNVTTPIGNTVFDLSANTCEAAYSICEKASPGTTPPVQTEIPPSGVAEKRAGQKPERVNKNFKPFGDFGGNSVIRNFHKFTGGLFRHW